MPACCTRTPTSSGRPVKSMNPVWQTFLPPPAQARLEKLTALAALLREWNTRHNLVSRKDVESLEENHLLPSAALAWWGSFAAGTRVIDAGTGGGLPGLVLAACFPNNRFVLVDSIGKKIEAVAAMAERLDLRNVECRHDRLENLDIKASYVVGRAVAPFSQLWKWVAPLLEVGHGPPPPAPIANPRWDAPAQTILEPGLWYWKGTRYREELAASGLQASHVCILAERIPWPGLEGKFIVHLAPPTAAQRPPHRR